MVGAATWCFDQEINIGKSLGTKVNVSKGQFILIVLSIVQILRIMKLMWILSSPSKPKQGYFFGIFTNLLQNNETFKFYKPAVI